MTVRWALLAMLVPALSGQEAASRPNFVVVVADDATWSDLGCYGGQARTPVLDRLCRQGLLFERCFQSAPMCSPTRHALYTGRHPVSIGAYPNHTFAREGTRSVAHHLGGLGYEVGLWNKTHVEPKSVFPFRYLKAPKDKRAGGGQLAAFVAEAAAAKKPFCLFVCSNEPHAPWNRGDASRYPPAGLQLPPHWVDTPATRDAYSRHLAEITFFDRQVGDCLQVLERNGLTESTLVMVLSEQGNQFPFAKWTCYEAGLRSGMIVRWPGRVATDRRTRAMVEYVDVVPTLIEAAGGAVPAGLDGNSFLKVLEGKADRHDTHVFGLQTSRGINDGPEHYGIRSVRSERYRYVWNLTPKARFRNAVMRSRWWREWETAAESDRAAAALVERFVQRPEVELYDVESDPWCLEDLAGREDLAAVQADLANRLAAWMRQQGDEGQATELRAKERQKRRRPRR